MKDKTETFLAILFFVALFGIPIGIGATWFVITDQEVVIEGEVIDIKIQESGHFLGGNQYTLQLNTSIKWYEITKNQYYIIDIGDYIIMYASDRIEVTG